VEKLFEDCFPQRRKKQVRKWRLADRRTANPGFADSYIQEVADFCTIPDVGTWLPRLTNNFSWQKGKSPHDEADPIRAKMEPKRYLNVPQKSVGTGASKEGWGGLGKIS
jgi:hypothetical protein